MLNKFLPVWPEKFANKAWVEPQHPEKNKGPEQVLNFAEVMSSYSDGETCLTVAERRRQVFLTSPTTQSKTMAPTSAAISEPIKP